MSRLMEAFNRAISSIGTRYHIAKANAWRDQYNPLRGLTIRRAVQHLEAGERGVYAELQWLYRFMEMQDATLGALIENRSAAVKLFPHNQRGGISKNTYEIGILD